MAFKMKGHELPGPNQRKESPTKIISLIIGGISAIAAAAKKQKEKTKALKEKAKAEQQGGLDAAKETMSSGGGAKKFGADSGLGGSSTEFKAGK